MKKEFYDFDIEMTDEAPEKHVYRGSKYKALLEEKLNKTTE